MPDLPQPFIAVAIPAAYGAIIATSLYFSNAAGAFSVASAALAGAAGYASALLTTNGDWPLVPALMVGAAVSGALGGFMGAVTARMNPLVGGLATLAFGQAMVILALNMAVLGGARSFTGVPLLTDVWGVYAALALTLVAAWRFERSRLGYSALALRDDDVAASAIGVDVLKTRILVFAIGGAVAGVGGIFRVHYTLVQNPNDMAFWASLNYLIFWIAGGSYVFWGPAAGAILLTIAPELLRFSLSERYILYGLVLVALILLRPNGLFPRVPLGSRRLSLLTGRTPPGPKPHPPK